MYVNAECVEGSRAEISPGYTVEYKCNFYKTGQKHTNVASEKACAELAQQAGSDVSTQSASTQQCMVADANSKEGSAPGSTYMKRVVEQPSGEYDPFATGCQGEKQACVERELQLKRQLNDLAETTCPKKHTKFGTIDGKQYSIWCNRYHNPDGPKEVKSNVETLADCVKLCNARSWCVYVLQGTYKTQCQLYDRQVSASTTPGLYSIEWNCATRKQ